MVGELQQQTGLADPSGAGQQHYLRPAPLGPVQGCLEPAQLIGSADEPLRCQPIRHAASMAVASGDGNGPATCADPSPHCVLATYTLTGRPASCHQRRVAR